MTCEPSETSRSACQAFSDVAVVRLSIAHLRHGALELVAATASGTLLHVLDRHERRHLLRECGADELIDGDVLRLGELAHPLVKGLRQTQTDGGHDEPPMLLRNSPGVTAVMPKRSEPAKSLTLCVMITSHSASTASSSTVSYTHLTLPTNREV